MHIYLFASLSLCDDLERLSRGLLSLLAGHVPKAGPGQGWAVRPRWYPGVGAWQMETLDFGNKNFQCKCMDVCPSTYICVYTYMYIHVNI